LRAAVSSVRPSPTAPKRRTSNSGGTAGRSVGDDPGMRLTRVRPEAYQWNVVVRRRLRPGWVVMPAPE
jgi:hypothetical protein